GPKVVNELLQQGIFKTERIYALNTWAEKNETLTQHFQHHLTIINDSELNKISGLNTPNQVVALFKKKPEIPLPDLSGALHLMLDGIQDPGNLGTIIRTADWFGIKNIFCSLDTA